MDSLAAICESRYITEELIKARLYERMDEGTSYTQWAAKYHATRATEHLVKMAEAMGFDLVKREAAKIEEAA